MVRIDGTLACEWCYQDADWRAETPNGGRDVCQRHYEEIATARKGQGNALPLALAALVLMAQGRRGEA